jgi:hypothetical protein
MFMSASVRPVGTDVLIFVCSEPFVLLEQTSSSAISLAMF